LRVIELVAAGLAACAVLVVAPPARADGLSSDDGLSPVRAVVTAGASTSSLFGVGSAAGRLGIGLLGTHDKDTDVIGGVLVDADLGSTFGGLPLATFTLTAPILFVAGSFRIGAGPELMYLRLTRRDRSLESIDGAGIGVAGFVGLDLLRAEGDRAIYLALRPQVAWLHNGRDPLELDHFAVSPGIAFVIGARF
jgi:hypothetical protein